MNAAATRRIRAVWVTHVPAGMVVGMLCENVREAIFHRVRMTITRMGVPPAECKVKIGRPR